MPLNLRTSGGYLRHTRRYLRANQQKGWHLLSGEVAGGDLTSLTNEWGTGRRVMQNAALCRREI